MDLALRFLPKILGECRHQPEKEKAIGGAGEDLRFFVVWHTSWHTFLVGDLKDQI